MIIDKLNLNYNAIARRTLLVLTVIGFLFSLYYTFTNLTYPKNINIVLSFPFILFLTPYLFMSLYNIKRTESKMHIVPRFLRDVVDNVESGMDLISSIKSTVGNEYSVLNDDIKKLVNQLSWGINFDKAMINFAKNVGSNNLKRDFLLVIEARSIGGHVEKILRELSLKIEVDNLRNKERKSNLASNTFTGYISFVIFVFIIIIVYNNLFVGINNSFNENDLSVTELENNSNMMKINLTMLILLSYELAILSGFLFGLMQENNIISGAPHVVALVLIVFIGFFFFI